MAISKKILKNNKALSKNIGLFTGEYTDKRALVLDQPLTDLELTAVKDYYHLVILETDAALESVPEPDFVFWKEDSPYENSILSLPSLFTSEEITLVINYKAVEDLRKLNLDSTSLNVTYLPSQEEPSASPSEERQTSSGLNENEPGVHFALVAGCNEVYYTGTSDYATTVTKEDIVSFTEEKDKFYPKNLVKIDRLTVRHDYF